MSIFKLINSPEDTPKPPANERRYTVRDMRAIGLYQGVTDRARYNVDTSSATAMQEANASAARLAAMAAHEAMNSLNNMPPDFEQVPIPASSDESPVEVARRLTQAAYPNTSQEFTNA